MSIGIKTSALQRQLHTDGTKPSCEFDKNAFPLHDAQIGTTHTSRDSVQPTSSHTRSPSHCTFFFFPQLVDRSYRQRKKKEEQAISLLSYCATGPLLNETKKNKTKFILHRPLFVSTRADEAYPPTLKKQRNDCFDVFCSGRLNNRDNNLNGALICTIKVFFYGVNILLKNYSFNVVFHVTCVRRIHIAANVGKQ